MMGMRQVEFFTIKPKRTIQFQPRDLHVMLIKLNKDLKIGDPGEVISFFKRTG